MKICNVNKSPYFLQAWPKAVPEQAQVQERRDEGPVGVPHPRHQPHQGHRGEREREREGLQSADTRTS